MVTILRKVSDEIDVGDNTVYYSRHRIDTIPLSESVTSNLILRRTVQDITALTESILRRLSLKRLAQDTITKSESIHIVGQEQTYTVNVSDVIQLLESIFVITTPRRVEIHPEQPFYPRVRRSRFQKRFEYMY